MNLKELQLGETSILLSIRSHSGKNLEYFDEARKEKYLPHVIEPSLGVDRTFLAVLCSAYTIDEVEGEKRTYFDFIQELLRLK